MPQTIDVIFDGAVFKPKHLPDLLPNTECAFIIPDTVANGAVKARSEEPNGSTNPVPSTESALVWKIYDAKLKAALEPYQNGKIVALDLDTEDYEVADESIAAWKALKCRRPASRIALVVVGPVREHNAREHRVNRAVHGKEQLT